MRGNKNSLGSEAVREIVRNPRRRYLLYYLDDNGGEALLTEMVEQIAAWENGITSENTTNQQRKSVYSSLYQTHLPKLEELDVIRFDRDCGTVTMTDSGKRISLRFATDWYSFPWPKLLFGYGALYTFFHLLGNNLISTSGYYMLNSVFLIVFILLIGWWRYDHRSWKRQFRQYGPDYIVEVERPDDTISP